MSDSSSTKQLECDLLVIGSGAGGLSTAITAKKHGLDVIVVEKEEYFGGTTAFSGGVLWIPGNPHGKRNGVKDSREAVADLHEEPDRRVLRRGGGQCVPRQRTGDGGVVRARDRSQVRTDDVPRLPPRRAGRRRDRPLDPRGAVQRAQPRRRDRAAASAADDHHLHRDDVQLVECRSEALLQCDEVAGFGGVRRQAADQPLQGSGPISPRRANHERQRAGGAAGEDLLRPRHSDPHQRRGARAARVRRQGHRRSGARQARGHAHHRAARRGAGLRRLSARRRANHQDLSASAARRRASVAGAHRQHRRRPEARRKRRRQGRHPLQGRGRGRVDAGVAGAAIGRQVRRLPASARPLQARHHRRAAQRQALHQRVELLP